MVDAPRRILLIRPSALGDVARTVPALVTLRQAYPQAAIDWLVQDSYAEVIRHHPALHEAMPFARKAMARWYVKPAHLGALRQFLRRLRAGHYDLVVDLQGLFRSGFFARVTGAPVRLGFANAREGAAMFYTHRHALAPSLHTVERMLGLLTAHGLTVVKDLRLYVGDDDQRWARQYLAENNLTPGAYVVLAPTAQWLCKCWPIERWIELTRRLLASGNYGDKVIVLAAPHERPLIQPLLEAFAGPGAGPGADSPVLAPVTKVGQMMALLATCRRLICNDSAALHIAVGLDRPVTALFGPTDPALVGPYAREASVLRSPVASGLDPLRYRHLRDDQTCIAGIDVETVWRHVREQGG